MKNYFDLSDQLAIVTGASSGLGVEFAHALANQGANIALIARREDKLIELANILEAKYKVDVIVAVADLTKEDDVKNAVDKIYKKFNRIDILVNNAGTVNNKPTVDLSLEEWNHVIDINLGGLFLMTKYVARHMEAANYGRIINIASMNGIIASSIGTIAPYTASKGGVINLTRQWAAEYSKKGITVNAIAPGMFPSEIMDTDTAENPELQQYYNMTIPLGRPGTLAEIHPGIIFLASKENSYFTGQTIVIDGGTTIV